MEPNVPRFPYLRIMLENGSLVSLVYLSLAVVAEGARRFLPFAGAEHVCRVLESLPLKTLDLLGVLNVLRGDYFDGSISRVMVRVVLGLTTVGFIFLMSMGVGGLTWVLRELVIARRRA